MKEKGILKYGLFELKDGSMSDFFITTGKFDDGEGNSLMSDYYSDKIINDIGVGTFDFIYGPAYKGIPIAASIAQKMYDKYRINKRYGYDKKEEKKYGPKNESTFIGDLRENDRVLIVDDVITSGKTKIEQMNKLENLVKEVKVVSVLVLVDRCKDKRILEKYGIKLYSVLDYKELF